MESLQTIQRRIKGVKNINQITKAMELVAATKMRKSQEVALASRAYAYTALDFLANLSGIEGAQKPTLLKKRKVEKTAFVIVSSDKGLAGSFNSSVFRAFENYLKENKINEKSSSYIFIPFGQKSLTYLQRKGVKTDKVFTKIGDFTKPTEAKPISDYLCQGFVDKKWDKVIVFSQQFRSALKQDVLIRQVLPVERKIIQETINDLIPETGKFSELHVRNEKNMLEEKKVSLIDYLIEPSPTKVLKELAPHLVEMQIYHLILEANASEHAARRMAMKNASDNAEELAGNLTLEYNKSRQAAITREIIEIVAGAEAAK